MQGISVGVKYDIKEKEVKKIVEKKASKPAKKEKKVIKPKIIEPKKKIVKKVRKKNFVDTTPAKPKKIEPKPKLPIIKTEAKPKIKKSKVIKNKDKDFISIYEGRKVYENDYFADDLESLNLSSVHLRSIKNHLNFCFNNILSNQIDDKEIVKDLEIIFNLNKNGVIKFDFNKNIKKELLKDKKYQNYQNIVRKIQKSTNSCAIFRNLPTDQHDIWQEFKVVFKGGKGS